MPVSSVQFHDFDVWMPVGSILTVKTAVGLAPQAFPGALSCLVCAPVPSLQRLVFLS